MGRFEHGEIGDLDGAFWRWGFWTEQGRFEHGEFWRWGDWRFGWGFEHGEFWTEHGTWGDLDMNLV
jgi:hypothetical protein